MPSAARPEQVRKLRARLRVVCAYGQQASFTGWFVLGLAIAACSPPNSASPEGTISTRSSGTSATVPGTLVAPAPTRTVHRGIEPVATGQSIVLADLQGRVVFDDFEDVFAMDVDGGIWPASRPIPPLEFDGAWSPDGSWIVYRDSTRGINEDDEIFVARRTGPKAGT